MFKTKEAAQAEPTERNLAMRKLGENAVALDAVLAETAREGATRLKPFGKTLKDAIDFYLSHLNTLQSSISPVTWSRESWLNSIVVSESSREFFRQAPSSIHRSHRSAVSSALF
jgi:hypothetical protein